jgi:hypothetical protein
MPVLDVSDMMEMGAMRPGPINPTTYKNTDVTYSTSDPALADRTVRPSVFRRAINLCRNVLQTEIPSPISNSTISNSVMRASMFTESD